MAAASLSFLKSFKTLSKAELPSNLNINLVASPLLRV
jgi:hypothetical protein